MTESETHRALVQEALAGSGQVRFQTLLETCMPIADLRAVAKQFGLSPKGGYRIERAPAKVLAALVVETKSAEVYDELCKRLARAASAPAPAGDRDGGGEEAMRQIVKLHESAKGQLADQLEREREGSARLREREGALRRELESANEELARRRAALNELARAVDRPAQVVDDADVQRRLHEQQREIEFLSQTELGMRHREAEHVSLIRLLEARVEELEELVPKGRRKKDTKVDAAPRLAEGFRLPRFLPSFYKALEDKTRRAAEQALQAALLFCTEGPKYPGLEVKPLEGQELWSLRASLKLRVYFRPTADGGVDFLDVVDREDQHTALRRWKER
jgi:hypothetical protein